MILKSSAGGLRGNALFSEPVLPTYIPLPPEGLKFLNVNGVDKLDQNTLHSVKKRKQYLDIIGENRCAFQIFRKRSMKCKRIPGLPICAFLNDVNLIFDNCIKYWQWRETQEDREGSRAHKIC